MFSATSGQGYEGLAGDATGATGPYRRRTASSNNAGGGGAQESLTQTVPTASGLPSLSADGANATSAGVVAAVAVAGGAAVAAAPPPLSPSARGVIARGMPWEDAGSGSGNSSATSVASCTADGGDISRPHKRRPPSRDRMHTHSRSLSGENIIIVRGAAALGNVPSSSSFDRRQRLRYSSSSSSSSSTSLSPTTKHAATGESGVKSSGHGNSSSPMAPRSPESYPNTRSSSLMMRRSSSADRLTALNTTTSAFDSSAGDRASPSGARKRSAQEAEYDYQDYEHQHPPRKNEMKGKEGGRPQQHRQHQQQQRKGLSPAEAAVEEEGRKRARREVRETRLRHLAQELCPLVDRFGRILTDIAPQLWELGAQDANNVSAVPTTAGTNVPNGAATGQQFSFEASLLALLRDR